MGSDTQGDWREFAAADIEAAVYRKAQNPDLGDARSAGASANDVFAEAISDILSVLSHHLDDSHLAELKTGLAELRPYTPAYLVQKSLCTATPDCDQRHARA
jgi:hypothetical protein